MPMFNKALMVGLLTVISACAGNRTSPGFGAADVRRSWEGHWNREAWRVPSGSEVVAIEQLSCRRKGWREFVGVREFRRAYWCNFVLVYRQPDGVTKTLAIGPWLVGERERRQMAGM